MWKQTLIELIFTYSIAYILQYGIRDLQGVLSYYPEEMRVFYDRATFTCQKMDDVLDGYKANKT